MRIPVLTSDKGDWQPSFDTLCEWKNIGVLSAVEKKQQCTYRLVGKSKK